MTTLTKTEGEGNAKSIIPAKILLLCLFPFVGYLFQTFDSELAVVIPDSLRIKYFLLNKLPAFSMILWTVLVGLIPRNSRIFKIIPDLSFLFLPILLVFIVFLNKTVLIFGAADKPILYKNLLYWSLSIGIFFLLLKLPKKFLLKQSRLLTILMSLTAGSIALYVASWTLFDIRHPYNGNYLNFMIVINPIVQSAFGKTIYVDQYSQYGGYGIFLKSFFSIFAPSVLLITLIFSTLIALCVYSFYHVAHHLFRNYAIAMVVLFSSIYLEFYAVALWPGEKYFQVTPIRMAFPVFCSVLTLYSVKFPSRLRTPLYALIAICAVFWNLETGLVVVVALLCHSLYLTKGWKDFLTTSIFYIASLAVWFAFFVLFLQLSSHKPFSIELFVRALFIYGAGGLLLWNKIWIIILLIYGAGVVVSLTARRSEESETRRYDYLFFVSIMGLGLLLYHLLRENQHDATLTVNIWSVPIVLALLLAYSPIGSRRFQKVSVLNSANLPFLKALSKDKNRKLAKRMSQKKPELPPNVGILDKINNYSKQGIWLLSLFLLVFLSLCFFGIQSSTPVRDEPRIWQFGNANSNMGLYAVFDPKTNGLHYVTIGEQTRGAKSPWEIRAEFANKFKEKAVSHDLLVLSEYDALMYMYAKSSTPVTWADWRHSGVIVFPNKNGFKFDHDIALAKLKSGEVKRVILDQYVGNMLPPFSVHTACYGCDQKLYAYIQKNFVMVKSDSGGSVYDYYVSTGPVWKESTLSYWVRKNA